ncbi:phosphoribosyl-AMP cyclohydrolase [Roseibium algae]|uniref:Phosphoribosyl-AMP cyclohydrolase n=1 Tax=Roseibium algae TaxID=3123038 RepID=A0ABU8TN16_9HYPH
MTSSIFASGGDKSEIETGLSFQPKFDKDGLIAVVITDHISAEVLMVGYMNDEALKRTIDTCEAWYWSRSRQEYWKKGGTSGQIQKVMEIRTDCDQDAIVLKVSVEGNGATCHVGYNSCFFRKVVKTEDGTIALTSPDQGRVYDPKDVYGEK